MKNFVNESITEAKDQHIQWTLVLKNIVFNEWFIPCYTEQNLSVPSFLTMKNLIQNLGLTNTTFKEFFIISSKNIAFFLKFYHGF